MFSAVNVPRVSFSPIFQYFLTCMPYSICIYTYMAMDSSAHRYSTQQQRIATESAEQREARLQQVRSAQDPRIATESAEEREARLQQARSAQDRRIATESAEEREARLQ